METFCGRAVIFGKPNVGKSTLLNRIFHEKLFITSPRAQTTRQAVTGIYTEGRHQVLFSDTPGIISRTKYRLQELMELERTSACNEADTIVWMFFPDHRVSPEDEVLTETFRAKTVIPVINKIDTIRDKSRLLPLVRDIAGLGLPPAHLISALKDDGVQELKTAILESLPPGPFLYPEDVLSCHPERFFVAELIREQLFHLLRNEIPYSTSVMIEEMKDRSHGKTFIYSVIFVERESQKTIVVGQKGAMIKKIGSEARKDIERFLGRQVYLELRVKVARNWKRSENTARFMEPPRLG